MAHQFWLLQGDNNKADDRVLYAAGQKWLNKKHIMGRVVGCAPSHMPVWLY